MPATGGAGAPVCRQIVHVSCLLCGSKGCSFARIKTDGHYFKLLPGFEVHNPEGRHHPIQHLITKHRALVIDQREHHGFLSEVVTQFYVRAILIFEDEIEWELSIEFLIDAYVLEYFWQATRRARLVRSRTVKRRIALCLTELRDNS